MSEITSQTENPTHVELSGGGSAADFEQLLAKHGDDLDRFDTGAEAPVLSPEEEAARASAQEAAPDEGDADSSSDDSDTEAQAADADDDGDDSGQDAEGEGLEVAEVATALGLDEDQLDVTEDGELLVAYKVGDEQGFVTLAELRKGYQLERYVTQKSEHVAERQRTLETEHAQRSQVLESQHQQAEAMLEALRGRVLVKYEGTDWNALQQQDPGRYAALQLQMQNEMQTLNAEVGQLTHARQQQQDEAHQVYAQQQGEWLAAQRTQLFEHLPEMSRSETRDPKLQQFHSYLSNYGFSDEEIRSTLDHRMLRVINDAVQHQQAAEAATGSEPKKALAKKRVLRSPRIGKRASAAAAEGRPSTRAGRKQTAMRRLRNSGSAEDAVSFALESGVVDSML